MPKIVEKICPTVSVSWPVRYSQSTLILLFNSGDCIRFFDLELGADNATSYSATSYIVSVSWYVNNFMRLRLDCNEGELETTTDESEE